jgi:hypothetical protein
MIVRQGNKHLLVSSEGKVLGTHDSRRDAIKQEFAIEYSKARNAGHHEKVASKDEREGRMSKSQLFNISNMSTDMHRMMSDSEDLPEWVQIKIAEVNATLRSVYDYYKYEHYRSTKTAEVEYRGETFSGYNQPKQAPAGDDHKMVVLAKKGNEVKLVRFGKRGYEHNYSPEAKQNYLTRSAGIRNKSGELTKDDPFSPNYWARRVLWPQNQKADGKSSLEKGK